MQGVLAGVLRGSQVIRESQVTLSDPLNTSEGHKWCSEGQILGTGCPCCWSGESSSSRQVCVVKRLNQRVNKFDKTVTYLAERVNSSVKRGNSNIKRVASGVKRVTTGKSAHC